MATKKYHRVGTRPPRRSLWQRFNRLLDHPAVKWVITAFMFILGLALMGVAQPDFANAEPNDTIQLIPALATVCLLGSIGAFLFFSFQQPKR